MNIIKNSVFINHMYYPSYQLKGSEVLMMHPKVAGEIEVLRGKIGKPTYVSAPFFKKMYDTAKTFRGVVKDILVEHEGQCGVVMIPNLDTGKYEEHVDIILWHVVDGSLKTYAFMTCQPGVEIITGWMTSKAVVLDGLDDLETDWENVHYSAKLAPELDAIWRGTMCHVPYAICLMLCLKRWAKVEEKEVKINKAVRLSNDRDEVYKTASKYPMEILDSRWYTEICRDEEFAVRGHFRLQPYKNEAGEWDKKLIYINEFMKHGYHRKAGIDKQEL